MYPNPRDPPEALVDRVERVRRVARPEGIMFFSWRAFNEATLEALRTGPLVAPAQVPPMR